MNTELELAAKSDAQEIMTIQKEIAGALRETSLVLAKGTSKTAFEKLVRAVGGMEKSSRWWLGDAYQIAHDRYALRGEVRLSRDEINKWFCGVAGCSLK